MNKVAIITGSSRGIGASCALEFAKKGYKLALQGRDTGKLTEIKEKCLKNGCSGVLMIALDLSETEKLETLIQKTVTEFGRIDVLVNNAGTMRPGGIEDQTSEDFDFVMAVNCKAPVFLCKAALPYLKQTKGNIVNISSTSSFTPFQGILSYNMSKAALDHFTRTMATQLMFEGVKVNSVNPATVRTDIHYSKGYSEEQVQEYYNKVNKSQPLGGVIEPEQIANAVLMICSDQMPSLTGQTIIIDGGRSQHPV